MTSDTLHDTSTEHGDHAELDAQERLDELGTARSTSAIAERAELLRVLGRLDEALAVAEESYRLAFFTGDRERVTEARLRRARVLRDKGSLDRALSEAKACRQTARTEGWGELEASALYQQANMLVESGRLEDARDTVSQLIELRMAQHAPPEHIASLNRALEVILRRMIPESPRSSPAPSPASSSTPPTPPRA